MNTFNPFSLEGKTILVTGASSGIGRQCAIDCSKMGARVVLVARNEERLKEVMTLMNGQEHLSISFDLNETEKIEVLVKSIISHVGKLDGFIHAAGIQVSKPVKILSVEDYETVYRTNVLSCFEIIHQLSSIKNMNNGSSIVMISSITSIIGRATVSAYAASKGALISACKSMAIEFAKKQIRINCVSPGTILTPLMQELLEKLDDDAKAKRVDGFLLGLGKPNDISNACIFLLSDASRWVTGQNLIIDGGYTVK